MKVRLLRVVGFSEGDLEDASLSCAGRHLDKADSFVEMEFLKLSTCFTVRLVRLREFPTQMIRLTCQRTLRS